MTPPTGSVIFSGSCYRIISRSRKPFFNGMSFPVKRKSIFSYKAIAAALVDSTVSRSREH